MKIKLLTFALLFSILVEAQITKAETFLTGTKISFYPNECGNSIPEATGKLTFCDGVNNLGVVEHSYGLNDRGVIRMLPNYFNNDEVYVTRKGLSIRNTDGTWENIPNIAIPTYNAQGDWTNAASIENGLVLPNGKILIQSTTSTVQPTYVYDRTLKTFTSVSFPNNRFPKLFVYDADRNLTWIIAFNSSDRFLFNFDGANLTLVEQIIDIQGVDITLGSANLIYKDDYLYLAGSSGLHKIDVSNYMSSTVTVTSYNDSTTPSLPFNTVNDLQFDSNGDLWLAQSNANSDGSITKFNIANETYEIYQLESETPEINYAFQNIALDENDVVWTNTSTYSGIMELTFSGNTPNWNLQSSTDLETLAVPMTYNPNNIYFRNNQFYFTTVDFSSGSNNNFEVVINNNNSWSGRNDDEVGNLSEWMNNRFTSNTPDANGGVWWLNPLDGIVVYRDANDNHQSILVENLEFAFAVDDDEKAIIQGGSPSRVRKINFPSSSVISNASNIEAVDMKRAKDQIWVFSEFFGSRILDIYKDDLLIDTFNLDSWYNSVFHFAVDDNGEAWFIRNNSGIEINKFNISTESSTTYDVSSIVSLGALRKVAAAPNGGVWFLGNSGAVYQENDMFYSFLSTDYPDIFNAQDIIVDTNGKAYLLNDSGTIITVENPTAISPILTNTYVAGNNSILPALSHYLPRAITIDSEGSIWTHASQNAFKLIDNDFATEYIAQPTLSNTKEDFISKLEVYPNPTNAVVNIKSKLTIDKVEVYSILGNKVAVFKNTNTLNLNKIKPGIYILKINSDEKTTNKKVVIK